MKRLILPVLCLGLLTGCMRVYDGPVEQEKVLTQKSVYLSMTPEDVYSEGREMYTYDIYGNLGRVTVYDGNELVSEEHRRYDDRGNVTEVITWAYTGRLGRVTRRVKSAYDAEGRLTDYSVQNCWGVEEYGYALVYEDGGDTITTISRSESTEQTSTTRHYRDARGNVVKSCYEDGGETRCTYDEAGNNTRWETWKDGVLQESCDMTYDGENRLLESVTRNAEGVAVSRYTREYSEYDYGWMVTTHFGDGTSRSESYSSDGSIVTAQNFDEHGRNHLEEHYFYDYIEVPKKEE